MSPQIRVYGEDGNRSNNLRGEKIMGKNLVAGAIALAATGAIALGASVAPASALADGADVTCAFVACSERCVTQASGCLGYIDEDFDGVCDNRGDVACPGGACDGTGRTTRGASGSSSVNGVCDGSGARHHGGGRHGAHRCW